MFEVKQNTGKNSTVEVEEIVIPAYPKSKKGLKFTTDQSLNSGSDRAWNVEKAIKDYANSRGYAQQTGLDTKFERVYVRDGHMIEYNIRQGVKSDSRYQDAEQDALGKCSKVNEKYGVAIRQLKNLISKLENKNREELSKVREELIQVQVSVACEIGIPNDLDDHHKKTILEPSFPYIPIDRDSYAYYGQENVLPDGDINWILELL